jgi:hypothetical protein
MDRSDAEQEGIQLTPVSTTRLIARDEANAAILLHLKLCPLIEQDVARRLRSLELSFWKLTAFMLGSGVLGGAAGATVFKAFGG